MRTTRAKLWFLMLVATWLIVLMTQVIGMKKQLNRVVWESNEVIERIDNIERGISEKIKEFINNK